MKKALKVIGITFAAILVGGAIAVFVYTDGNLHAEERSIAKAYDSGMVEKRAVVDGNTINYGEGPDNGPALMLVHGQGMEWQDYASVLPELTKRYHVFAVDCFGHGKSDRDPTLYSCKLNGDALISFAEQVIGGDTSYPAILRAVSSQPTSQRTIPTLRASYWKTRRCSG